ncbi:MAG: 2,3-diphosphoglycerate-dependent phosphoglycerate mutase [Gammaproteobacteria bacterium]
MSARLILLRHGQSIWNKENLFTGWNDIDLTEQGSAEGVEAARLLTEEGVDLRLAFTSVLKRAIRTLWIVLDELDRMWIPVERSWRLNERHYGALQGLNKAETAAKYGAEQVHIWRRSYATPPPALETDDDRHPINDPCYADVDPSLLPASESLSDTLDRVKPYWEQSIKPALNGDGDVLIAAHGNSLRALVKMFDGMDDDEITQFNIPTGVPIVYDLDGDRPLNRRFLGDPEAVKAAAEAVAKQSETSA